MAKELIRGCMHALLKGKSRREKNIPGMHGGVDGKRRRGKNLVVNEWLWLNANFVRCCRNTPHGMGLGW